MLFPFLRSTIPRSRLAVHSLIFMLHVTCLVPPLPSGGAHTSHRTAFFYFNLYFPDNVALAVNRGEVRSHGVGHRNPTPDRTHLIPGRGTPQSMGFRGSGAGIVSERPARTLRVVGPFSFTGRTGMSSRGKLTYEHNSYRTYCGSST